jgi:hypothetical protein
MNKLTRKKTPAPLSLTREEVLEKILHSYERYYDIKKEEVEAPFAAEAVFHVHDDGYFLIKAAKISAQENHEYVYFAVTEDLTEESLRSLDEQAWERGLAQVVPGPDHRSSDITLIILADRIREQATEEIRRIKHYRSYRYRLQGWSSYRLIALELSTGQIIHNRLGESLEKLIRNIVFA